MNIRAIQYSARNESLRAKGFKSYEEFLSSEIWRKIKERIKKRSTWQQFWQKCWCCRTQGIKLIPHHRDYSGVTRVKVGSIIPVCNRCHFEIHKLHHENEKISIRQATIRIKKKYS